MSNTTGCRRQSYLQERRDDELEEVWPRQNKTSKNASTRQPSREQPTAWKLTKTFEAHHLDEEGGREILYVFVSLSLLKERTTSAFIESNLKVWDLETY